MYKSVTIKLTLYYMAIICGICIAFSLAIYRFAMSEVHYGLTTQSQRVIKEFPGFDFNFKSDWDYEKASHRIILNLVNFNLLVLLISGFASYGLARRTLKPIENSHEQQKRFTADVSHELRTPLTALKMATEVTLLDKSAKPKELREALESNLEEAQKLETLINNLFKLTRLEVNELEQYFTEVDAKQIIKDAITDTKQRADARRINISNTSSGGTILGDRTSLAQLLTILLDNAIKYSPEKSDIVISSHKNKSHITIQIVDHGIGIEPESLQHVFDRFYRADTARTRSDASGFGLGLSIAKLIADVHKGTITIRSQVGKGTTVMLELPLTSTKA